MPTVLTARARTAVLAALLVSAIVVPMTTSSPVAAETAPTPLRDRVAFGAYVPDLPDGRTQLPALEARLGAPLQLASAFADWSYVFGGANDRWMADSGRRAVLYSWEPFGIRFADIAGGARDAYLQRVADSMKAYPYDLYVRPWGEMNANWSSWQPTAAGEKPDGGTPAQFLAAWRHTVDFFRSRGVRNLKFVFDPDASDYAENTRIASIWPGADYVDVLGIDGYNWGADRTTGDTWREFDTIFTGMYGILTGLHPTAPVWITELASKEPSVADGAPIDTAHSKGAWIERMMSSTGFPRVTALAWFNVRKERDWRLESSSVSLAAIRDQLARRTGTAPTTTTTTTTAPTTTTTRASTTTSTTRASTTTSTTRSSTTTTTTRPPSTTTTRATTTTTRAPTTTTTRPPLASALANGSLERDADGDGRPDCWTPAGFGANWATWSRTGDAHSGAAAQRVDVGIWFGGQARLVADTANPGCAPAIAPGASYRLGAWYKGSRAPYLVASYRDGGGVWRSWFTAAASPVSATWAEAAAVTPPAPADATAVSFGLAVGGTGWLITDDYRIDRL